MIHCLGKSVSLIIPFDSYCMFDQEVRHDYGLTMSQVVKKTIINSIALFGAKNNCVNVINNPKMFNGERDDLAIKPCIPH